MENYGNDMYLSHPSIDFTLLDRPAGIMMSAREPAASIPQGNTSFPSFNLFDGAGAVPYSDRLVSNHGSYALESHNNVTRRHAPGEFVSFPDQRKGEHDFFEQGNELEKSGSGTWPRNEQSAYFPPRVSSLGERVQGPFHLKNSYEAFAEQANAEARMPHTSVGLLKPMAGEVMDHPTLMNASLSAQKESRNQAFNPPCAPPGRSRNFAPTRMGVPSHHSVMENRSYSGAQYQTQVESYDVSGQTGVALNHAQGPNFLETQVPRKGAMQHSQAVASKQFQGFSRTAGHSELHSPQLQELFLAHTHPPKQVEESRQEYVLQQAPNRSSRTSYSDLLHGPDTPPPQQQTTQEFENHASVLSSQNVEGMGWSVDRPLYYQEPANDLGMAHNENIQSQMSSLRKPMDANNYTGNLKDWNGHLLASSREGQVVPEHIDGKWKSSSHQIGRPVLETVRSGSQHLTTDFGLGNDSFDLRKTNQPLAKLNVTQSSGEWVLRQKGGSLSQVNALSQSQQHFQEMQFVEQRNRLSEPKQPLLSPNVSFLPPSFNSAKRTLKIDMQQRANSLTAMENLAERMPQNLPGIPLDFVAASGQPQRLASSLSESPSRPMTAEVGGWHQAYSWEGSQAPQPSRVTGFNLESTPDTNYSALGINNPQQLPMSSVHVGPFEASDRRQQGLFNTQVVAMDVKTSVAGSGPVSNQHIPMSLHGYRKDVGAINESNNRAQPSPEPTSQFQGAWIKYTQKQCPPEGEFLGQDGIRRQGGYLHQGYLNPESSFPTPAMSNNTISTSVPYASNQFVHEGQLPQKTSQLHASSDQTAGLPTVNLMNTVRRHAMNFVPNEMAPKQGGSFRSVEPQDNFVNRQEEVPQQQVNSCTANVSLAHLKGNQSPTSLSPQHFRLGLGPSQDSQHPTDASWRSLPIQQSSSREVPTLKFAHKTMSVELPNRRTISETTTKDEIELNQASKKRMLLQSSGTTPPVVVNVPSSVLRERASPDTSSTSSFVSGTSLVSASTNSHFNECNIGREPNQIRVKVRQDTSSGVSRVQTSAVDCASQQEAMNGYIGKSSCIANYVKLPKQGAGGQHLIDSPTQLDRDGNGVNIMQDHNLNNIPLRQVGNRPSAFNFKGLEPASKASELKHPNSFVNYGPLRQVGNRPNALNYQGLETASKASELKHPKSMVNNGHHFSNILESSRMPPSSAGVVKGGGQKRETMQGSTMMLRNSSTWSAEEHSVQASSMQCASNDNLNAHRVTQFGNDVSGPMPSTSSSYIGGRHHLPASIDGHSSHALQAWCPSQDANSYQHARSLDSHASETKAVEINTRKPPLRAPSSSVFRPGMQAPIHKDLGQRHNFVGLEPCARVDGSPESVSLPFPESNQLSSNFGKNLAEPIHPVVWPAKRHSGNAHSLAAIENPLDVKKQNKFSFSDSESGDITQPVGTLEHSQMQKDLGTLDKDVPNPTKLNHLTLTYAGFKHTDIQLSENPQHQPAGNKEIEVMACDTQMSVDNSTMIQEVVRIPTQGPSMLKNEGQLSALKAFTSEEVLLPSKKRKKQYPLLNPWHLVVAQPSFDLPSNSDAEMAWATALNRVPDKDFSATHEENMTSVFRAKRRSILATQSLQRLFPPILDGLMYGTIPAELECGIYSLAKHALEDACRVIAKTKDQADTNLSAMSLPCQGQVGGFANDSELMSCIESFMGRIKNLGMELARLECSTSVSELQGETHDLEKLSIVNRLAKHHGIGFTMDSSNSCYIEDILEFGAGGRKLPPQKYVTAAPLPRMLPEGVRCLSL